MGDVLHQEFFLVFAVDIEVEGVEDLQGFEVTDVFIRRFAG